MSGLQIYKFIKENSCLVIREMHIKFLNPVSNGNLRAFISRTSILWSQFVKSTTKMNFSFIFVALTAITLPVTSTIICVKGRDDRIQYCMKCFGQTFRQRHCMVEEPRFAINSVEVKSKYLVVNLDGTVIIDISYYSFCTQINSKPCNQTYINDYSNCVTGYCNNLRSRDYSPDDPSVDFRNR